jgi:putative flavoprotein involved in K+ transport
MRLYGRLSDVRHGRLRFASDLKKNLDAADAVSESIKDSIDAHIGAHRIQAPRENRYVPVWEPPATGETQLAATEIGAVVWSTGFGRDHRWVEVPVFDGRGYPTHHRGVTSCPGLYFLGLPWQYTWGSGRFCGVADDAEYLTRRIQHALGPGDRSPRVVDVPWIAGTRTDTFPNDTDWVAPRTVA